MLNPISPDTLFAGQRIICLPSCHSTNDIALNLLTEPDVFEGSVIITSNQTAGKGQRGNNWEAEPGKNLTFSIILKPSFLNISNQFFLNIITSLAVHQTVTHFLNKKINIKWPNDIYFSEKKISGILIQNLVKGEVLNNSIIGIGLNVNQRDFIDSKAVSMAMVAGNSFSLEEVLKKLLEDLEKFYLMLKAGNLSFLKTKYLESLYWLNQERIFKAGDSFNGVIVGVDETGRLAVRVDSTIKYFSLKEIQYVS